MPLNIPQNVRSLASSINARISAAPVDQGQGSLGDYPSTDGEHLCDVLGLDVDFQAKFGWVDQGTKQRVDREGLSFAIKFCKRDDPAGPRNFSSPRFVIPYNDQNLPNNQKQRSDIATGRINGYLTPLLLAKPKELISALETVQALFDGAAANNTCVQARVRTKVEKGVVGNDGRKRDNHDCWILEMTSSGISAASGAAEDDHAASGN